MASGRSISINVEPKVSGTTAKLCAAVLELYLNQHPELELKVKTLNDGTVTVGFTNRMVEDILERHKQEEEARRFDRSKCCGMGSSACETCDMPCPYR